MPDSDPIPDPIMARLEDQIAWYDRKSSSYQKAYRWIKIAEIIAAASIPFVGSFRLAYTAWITGFLGVLITVLEGLLHLYQHQQNWINYRCTTEALKHEKYLYLAHAGPYAAVKDAHALLAERIESRIAEEHAKWSSVHQEHRSGKVEGEAGGVAATAHAQ